MHPPPSPARANLTLITECTPESSGCNSVYSVVPPAFVAGGGQNGRPERGMGVNILEDERNRIALLQ